MSTLTPELEALRASFSTPALDALVAAMEKGPDGLPLFTEANFMGLIRSAEGTPYLYGGIDPFHGGADCSGLIYWAALQCGVTLPRTTEAEWAGLPHSTDWQAAPVASIIEFEVPGDGGSPPQHVGVVLSPGTMIDDPHTGAVVSVDIIPNEPGIIWPYGYCTLPFVNSPTPPPAPPPTPVLQEDDFMPNLISTDSAGTGYVVAADFSSKTGLVSPQDEETLLKLTVPATPSNPGGQPLYLRAGLTDGQLSVIPNA